MSRWLFISAFFATLMGCATTAHKELDIHVDRRISPPDQSFLNKWQGKNLDLLNPGAHEDYISWWKTYSQALLNKDSQTHASCEGFKSLALNSAFPLKDLALLRAHAVCPSNEKDLPALPTDVNSWYRDLVADIKLKHGGETNNAAETLDGTLEKARLETNKKTKEEWLQKALALAQKLQRPHDVDQVQQLLYKNSPRLMPNPEFKDLANVAADQRFHRDFDKALATYKKILTSPKASADDIFQSQKSIRHTYKVWQKRNDYITSTVDLVNSSQKYYLAHKKDHHALVRYHDAQILLARTLWTEDQTSRAVQTLKDTQRRLMGVYPMDEVYFILGRISEEKGDLPKALEYFQASYDQPVSLAGLRDKLTWMKAWIAYKLKKYDAAAKSFEQMKTLVKDPSDKARASFWLGRSLAKLGQAAQAQAEWQSVSTEDSLGYYGVLAYHELKKDFPPLDVDAKEDQKFTLLGLNDLDPQRQLAVEWLIAVGESNFAQNALDQTVEELKKKNVTKDETWLTVSSAYARAGLYLPLFTTLGNLQPKVKEQLLGSHPDLLFPQPYGDLVANASSKSGIPPEFIYAIMRQESAFNPQARSSADAFGLMQLLPSVAQNLATANHIPFNDALDLYEPQTAITLGAFELKSLMKKYNNHMILAASGYNANDSAIRGWLKVRYREDSVEFIEEIPYEETRTYVKLVLRNNVFYQRLLHSKQSLKFPDNILTLSK